MTEPTTTIASSVAAVSMMTTALFGFDYHSMVWGLLGALIAARQGPSSEWLRAMAAALLSMLVGAAFGEAAIAGLALIFPGGNVKPILFFACIIGGYGGATLVIRCLDAVFARVKVLGDKS